MTPEVRERLTKELNELTHDEKVGVFVLATIQNLKKKGFVEGGIIEATSDAMGMLEIMEDDGFRPSHIEAVRAIAELQWMNEHPEECDFEK